MKPGGKLVGRIGALFAEAVEALGYAEAQRLFTKVAKSKRKSRKKYDRLDELLLFHYYFGSWNGHRFIENKNLLVRFVAEGHLQRFLAAHNVRGSRGLRTIYEPATIERRIDRLLERVPAAEALNIHGEPVVIAAQHGKSARGKPQRSKSAKGKHRTNR